MITTAATFPLAAQERRSLEGLLGGVVAEVKTALV